MISAADAIAQLKKDNANAVVLKLDDLRALASSVSAASTTPKGILYSGPIDGVPSYKVAPSVAESMGWGVIDATQRAALLISYEFQHVDAS